MQELIAHFTADYLLQGKWTAQNKSKSSLVCTWHVFCYTTFVCFILGRFDLFLWIAIPHWVIDRFALANWWAKINNGRVIEEARGDWDRCFTTVVYCVNDALMHLWCLEAALRWA